MYSPGHPDADPEGFVTFPNVNPVHEVVNLMSASRSYEANATAIDTLKTMAQTGLDIARSSSGRKKMTTWHEVAT